VPTASDRLVYFDASVALEVVLGQPRAQQAAAAWAAADRRISSVLFEAECRTAVRRAARSGGSRQGLALQKRRDEALEDWFTRLEFHAVDRAVMERLAAEPRLGACRTLDALHLATAIELRAASGAELAICTLDADMVAVARELGFGVVP
jgi:predicted nucleic acid-binding protein